MEKVKKQGMESLFCPYEQALALKELGFDEKCGACYYKKFDNEIGYHKVYRDFNFVSLTVSAPTFSQAFRFFREKYGLHYIICKNIQMDGYGYREVILISYMEENENTIFKTYEEAELACLVKLIEIAKEQNVK